MSTIEEKALGNIVRTGTVPIVGALEAAEAPVRKGLNFMDTSSAAAECVTLMTAGGGVVNLFPTGQGNVIGNPVQPVVKISANPKTTDLMADHIDHDCSGLLALSDPATPGAPRIQPRAANPAARRESSRAPSVAGGSNP